MKARMSDPRIPVVGTVLSRMYKGQQIDVLVQENGFFYKGQLYMSLCGVTRAIVQGSGHRGGFQFFGLGKKQPKNDASAISLTDASLNNLEEGKEEFSE